MGHFQSFVLIPVNVNHNWHLLHLGMEGLEIAILSLNFLLVSEWFSFSSAFVHGRDVGSEGLE